MIIRVKLYAGLEKKLRVPANGRQVELEVEEGSTVARVLEPLGVPLDQAKLILVNARHAALETVLQPDDLLVVFPPVGGG